MSAVLGMEPGRGSHEADGRRWTLTIVAVLRVASGAPARYLGSAVAMVLLAAVAASVPWCVQYVFANSDAVVLEQGTLTFGTLEKPRGYYSGIPWAVAPSGLTLSRTRLPLLRMDWSSKHFPDPAAGSTYFYGGPSLLLQSARTVPLWTPTLILLIGVSFTWGYARGASPPARWARRIRRTLTVVAVISLLGSMLWSGGSHRFVGGARYFAFPGGGVTIGREVSYMGAYRLRGFGVVLPRYEGPRALEFVGTWSLHIPLWHLGLMCGVAAAYLHGRAVAYRLWRGESCIRCGYSLRGLSSKQCPECGCEH